MPMLAAGATATHGAMKHRRCQERRASAGAAPQVRALERGAVVPTANRTRTQTVALVDTVCASARPSHPCRRDDGATQARCALLARGGADPSILTPGAFHADSAWVVAANSAARFSYTPSG
jgi:hypothetical protein